LESRYALREIEGAIGRDCRRLEDGRRALFRHTLFHRIARNDFRERRDEISVLSASYIATACMASNPKIGIGRAVEIVSEMRRDLVRSVFPYIDLEEADKDIEDSDKPKSYEDYSEYFDELDRIEEEAVSGQNDIISEEE